MPRTIATEPPGCSPVRAITSDVLGLLKVVQSQGEKQKHQVVDTWGAPDPSRCVLAASVANHPGNPLVAVARKNGEIEILNACDGTICASRNIADSDDKEHPNSSKVESDPVVGLHLLKRRSNMFAACTEKGIASLNYIQGGDTAEVNSPTVLKLCNSGSISCFSIDGSETHSAVGGKGVEVSLWDLNACTKIWTAKSPPLNSLRIYTPPWITTLTFLEKEDHRKIVTGTCQHQVRLYDIAAQRRPVRTIDFRESPIKVVTEDPDGFTVYVGNGTGDLASFDMRTGKMIGSFVGKCCGSIKSIARHPELPVLASCGLDRYLRLWDVKTRQLLEAVFLKQVLTNVVFDASSVRQGVSSPKPNEELATNQTEEVKDTNGSKRSSATLNSLEHDEKGSKKAKLKKKKRVENAT
ncbi:uncharacterized protein LOC116262087 [Nymphaea colorata]|nr:uncharacterized protein LOC116262087 [Nymphaea colorata]